MLYPLPFKIFYKFKAKETMTFLKRINYFIYNYDMYLYFSNKCTVSFIRQKGTKGAPNLCTIGFYM